MNILIRTSGRPNYFRNCVKSIKKFLPDAKLHVSSDCKDDNDYIHRLCDGMDYRIYQIDKEAVIKLCSQIKITRKEFVYNYYFNIMKPSLNGWCLTIDDDDELVMTPSFADCPDNIYLYKQFVKNRTFPSDKNFGKPPVLNDIGGNCIIFHSSKMVDWKPQRGGDYDFISEMYKSNNPVWIDRILVKAQTDGNWGRRNDLEV
jgi:hypothetical protein